MTVFHADDYVDFLKTIHPNNEHNFHREVEKFHIDMDCPVFEGLWKYNQLSAGGSVGNYKSETDKLFLEFSSKQQIFFLQFCC